jgi:hypothetical protein
VPKSLSDAKRAAAETSQIRLFSPERIADPSPKCSNPMPGRPGTRSELMRSQTMNLRKLAAFLPRRILVSGGLELDTKLQFALLTLGHAPTRYNATVRSVSGSPISLIGTSSAQNQDERGE